MAKKVYILEENDYPCREHIPPNFQDWFECQENWDRLPQFLDRSCYQT